MPESYISKKLKENVFKRALGYCEYCYAPSSFSPDTFPIDHIFPISLGGKTLFKNLALSCGKCNGHKHNKTAHKDPITNIETPIFHPRLDYWLEHFQWNEDETLIVGLTPKGRATVELLDVNRAGNVNLRILLQLVGMHPPKFYPKT